MKRLVKAGTMLLAIFILLASQAEASFIDIGITARVRQVDDSFGILGGTIHVNDIINGKYTYDSTTPDLEVLSSVGLYKYTAAPFGITLSVNGLTFRTNPSSVNFLIQVGNNIFAHDIYTVLSSSNIFSKGTPGMISWVLDDPTHTALSSDTLPLTAPVLANWPSDFGLTINNNAFSIRADVTQAQIIPATTVPEPSTTLLLGIALAGILGYGWRRKHTA